MIWLFPFQDAIAENLGCDPQPPSDRCLLEPRRSVRAEIPKWLLLDGSASPASILAAPGVRVHLLKIQVPLFLLPVQFRVRSYGPGECLRASAPCFRSFVPGFSITIWSGGSVYPPPPAIPHSPGMESRRGEVSRLSPGS